MIFTSRFSRIALIILAVCFALAALPVCPAQAATTAPVLAPSPVLIAQSAPQSWRALAARLERDGLYGEDLEDAFKALNTPTQDPMGRKIEELFTSKFSPPPPPPPPGTKPKPPVYIYRSVVTEENAVTCREFIETHANAFARAEKTYGVPRDIAVSLLFVETRLGQFLGKNDVFFTLASMANSRSPEQIDTWLAKLDRPERHLDWITETMHKRSDWAYRELAAFIRYARANNVNMLSVPGSVYGAMGLCQFMPSNLEPYGADGNNDGVVNLFEVDDAIASLSNYLQKNGWKPGLSRAQQHTVLKRYNRLNIYANSILCLADLVRGEPMGKPVIPAPAKKQPAKKTAPKQAAKKAPAKK